MAAKNWRKRTTKKTVAGDENISTTITWNATPTPTHTGITVTSTDAAKATALSGLGLIKMRIQKLLEEVVLLERDVNNG